ncbi:MAG: preprotein translocase subunit SecG [Gammaproteobacteria bacterium]|nr:preprotein translocase subunit SecG [Gammaproteobacteria bacterium]
MLQTILLVVHILLALALIAIILLQQGRGATAGAAFGSGASGTVFGARGSATFLSRTTSILAVLFFGNCLLLAWLATGHSAPKSIAEQIEQQAVTADAVEKSINEALEKALPPVDPASPPIPSAAPPTLEQTTPMTPPTTQGEAPPVQPAGEKP